MKTDIDALMAERGIGALLVVGAGQHNPAMYYFTGGAHLTDAYLIKKRGEPATLYHRSMERDEAAASGLETRTIDQSNLEELFKGSSESFALRVTGNSMIDDQIRDGDYVICERRSSARNGETVVALLEDGEATLKRFYREQERIRLQPANSEFKPIFVDNVDIQGVVRGVIRKV